MHHFMRGLALMTFAVCVLGSAAETPTTKKEDAAAIRKRFADAPCQVLKIAEPVEVSEIHYYKDGGSIGLVLTDEKKVQHRVCFDGRKRGVFPIVFDVIYPSQPGGRVVSVRGPEESDLYRVLLRWANRHPQRPALYDESIRIDDAKSLKMWEVREFFLRLDRRFTS